MQKISPSPEGEYRDRKRSIIATATWVTSAHCISSHRHSRGQLLYSPGRAIKVQVNQRNWYLTPNQAIWIRSGDMHQVISCGEIEYRSVYVHQIDAVSISAFSGPVQLPPLLPSLVTESSCFAAEYQPGSAESRLNQVILDQLGKIRSSEHGVPLPRDGIVHRICEHLIQEPATKQSLANWGIQVGISERQLIRLFREQTGLTYTAWRQRFMVSHAIQCMRAGESVTRISLDMGYNSPGAFSQMFKRVTGLSPQRFKSLNYLM